MSLTELVGVVRGLIGEVERLREETEKLKAALAAAKRENQQLKDEIRRLKGLPPRPPIKPSGWRRRRIVRRRKGQPGGWAAAASARPRRVEVEHRPDGDADRFGPGGFAPQGLRGDHRSGHRVQTRSDALPARALGDAGRAAVTADPPAGVVGGCGPHLHRLVLTLHFRGQMTRADRGRADRGRPFDLEAPGGAALDRQAGGVPRRGGTRLQRGLRASPFVSVDDTGARHAGKACYTTQFGSDRFTAFRTGPSKSRLAFLRNLLGGTRYMVNEAAAAYMRAANLAHGVVDALSGAKVLEFACEAEWTAISARLA